MQSAITQYFGGAQKPFFLKRKAPPEEQSSNEEPDWLVLVVDDEPAVHQVTKLALADLVVDQRHLRFLSALSAAEAQQLIQEHPDIAVALIDVVMETDHAGLDLVTWLRKQSRQSLRILLRTGQAGMAPAVDVVKSYDIDAYLEKSLMSTERLQAQVIIQLRAHQKAARAAVSAH